MKLRTYQERGKSNILQNRSHALFFQMGYGKTGTVLSAVNELMWDRLEVRRVLILAPKRVAHIEWPKQIAMWSHGARLSVVYSDKAKQIREDVEFYLMSYSTLPWLYREVINNPEGLPRFDMIVYDESTFLKVSSTTRWKLCDAMFSKVPRKLILAGKPAPNGLLDLWAQIYLLDGGKRLMRSFEDFRTNKFLVTGGLIRNRYEPMSGTKDWVAQQLADLVTTVEPHEKLQLPPLIESDMFCEMDIKERTAYDRLEKKDIFDGMDFQKICDNPASSMMSLRQFTQGFVYATKQKGPDAEKTPTETVHYHKVEAVQEIYDGNSDSNILIAVQFIEDIRRLQARFNCPAIYSATSDKDATRYIEQWNEGKLSMLAVHPASVSHGMNLQSGGNIIIWFGLPWDLDQYDQLNARLYRSGQEKTVFVYRILMKDTIDEVIYAALQKKDRTQTAMLDALSGYVTNKYKGGI